MKKDECVASRDVDNSKVKIMATIGMTFILINSLQNPISILFSMVFLASLNYSIPLTRKKTSLLL